MLSFYINHVFPLTWASLFRALTYFFSHFLFISLHLFISPPYPILFINPFHLHPIHPIHSIRSKLPVHHPNHPAPQPPDLTTAPRNMTLRIKENLRIATTAVSHHSTAACRGTSCASTRCTATKVSQILMQTCRRGAITARQRSMILSIRKNLKILVCRYLCGKRAIIR